MSEFYINDQNESSQTVRQKTYTISFQTLGCKVNRYETDAVRQAFERNGFQVIPDSEAVDVFVINTCTVTAEADRKSRQMIRRARRRNPDALIVAMGCHVELLKSASEADISVGTVNRISVVGMVLEKLRSQTPDFPAEQTDESAAEHETESAAEHIMEPGHMEYNNGNNTFQEFGPVLSQEETRAYIKIEDGCDSFCSYCIIPFARGRVVSRKAQDILREAEELGSRGFHEIVLTGIHICSYGKDTGEGIAALEKLLFDLEKIPAIHRIRLGSLEPNSMTEEFIHSLSLLKKLCPHFHISLQSGSDAVLKRMNRRYNTQTYRNVISQLRSSFENSSVTTDIIVAFPAETKDEHEESLRFCREMGFSRIHVFPFSAREGTKAAAMLPKISDETAAERRDDFLCLSQELSDNYCRALVGSTAEVLLETKNKENYYSGYTKQYVKLHIAAENELQQGVEVKVYIDSYINGELFGRIT